VRFSAELQAGAPDAGWIAIAQSSTGLMGSDGTGRAAVGLLRSANGDVKAYELASNPNVALLSLNPGNVFDADSFYVGDPVAGSAAAADGA